MVRRKDIEAEINGYLKALSEMGFPFQKAILFGSYVKGKPHQYSDIDLAVWSASFTDPYFTIMEKVAHLRRVFKNIELHPFSLNDSSENNPFIREIENTGFRILPGEDFSFSKIDASEPLFFRDKQV
ncbi:MAG: nucleotidyltransferase domain-containing protein [Bacteroidota bacterium]|nr:nucleotidyltransferase domain-containing protein [Bacteroidota bacterium]